MTRTIQAASILALLVLSGLFAGCSIKTRHGDAVLERGGFDSLLAAPGSAWMRLPDFSLSEAGATYRWRVRDIPGEGGIPTAITVIGQKEDGHWDATADTVPWGRVVLRVQLIDLEGSILEDHRVRFSSWRGGGSSSSDGEPIVDFDIPSQRYRLMNDFDLAVTVETPSLRLIDHARVRGCADVRDPER